MEEAADCWGRNHDELFQELCFHFVKTIFGKDCFQILQKISEDISSVEQLKEVSGLGQSEFDLAFSKLAHKQIISMDPLEVNLFLVFNTVLYPHFVEYAENFAPIPQDRPYISYIINKVLDEPTLNSEKLVSSITTKYKDLNPMILTRLIDVLVRNGVLITNEESDSLKFNIPLFFAKQRLSALETLVEYNDRRVTEVVRAIFSEQLFFHSLETCTDQEFDQNELVPRVVELADLSEKEVLSIFAILKTHEYSLINPVKNVLTPSKAIRSFKMKKIAQLLSEIGYPFARRVINLLLKKESLEGNSVYEAILMASGKGRELLERLKFLGVLESENLQDAPHTTLKRQYVIWRISYFNSINNASSYLLGILAKLYYDLQTEQETFQSITQSDADGSRRKKFDDRTTILQNTMFSVTKRYIEIHEL